MFESMSTGDWLYMLFMHQACVYKTKHQYVKSNEILTTVIKEAYQNDSISDILKEGIEAFQVKINLKQEYLAYYLRKNILNSLTAMGFHGHPHFNELRSTVVSHRIFIRSQSLIAC